MGHTFSAGGSLEHFSVRG